MADQSKSGANGDSLAAEANPVQPVGEGEEENPQYLKTVNGLFQLKSITGDSFSLLPKGMTATCDNKSAVYRRDLVNRVLDGLHRVIRDHNSPGVYVQGPEGVGKSILLYTVTQIAKFKLGWITVYLPNCKVWAALNEFKAKAFFLDRVFSALKTCRRNSPIVMKGSKTGQKVKTKMKLKTKMVKIMDGVKQVMMKPTPKLFSQCTATHSVSSKALTTTARCCWYSTKSTLCGPKMRLPCI
jgi:hypothetical protein